MEHVMEERIGKRRADWWNDSTWASMEGATALLLACGMGRTTVVHDLCWEGRADVNAKTVDGMTCMMFAAVHGETEIVRQLIYRGADIHAKKKNGCTALMFAAAKGHPETVQLLCEVGADIAAIDTECMNALSLACSAGCAKSVDALCRAGASVDAVPGAYEGMSPLMFAIAGQINSDIVRILCELGADVEARDTKGLTAMDYALIGSCTGSALVLQKFGAKIPKARNASAY
jgi:ankyrin repeat protein